MNKKNKLNIEVKTNAPNIVPSAEELAKLKKLEDEKNKIAKKTT